MAKARWEYCIISDLRHEVEQRLELPAIQGRPERHRSSGCVLSRLGGYPRPWLCGPRQTPGPKRLVH